LARLAKGKTFIGRIERGFDFLGYHFSPSGLTVAAKTVANFIEKASRLCGQEGGAGFASAALEMHVERSARWSASGVVLDARPLKVPLARAMAGRSSNGA
jgi:hypothetical protein